jgi:septal ring factor EnvC (AmiA/AmiB activator)
MKLDIKWIAILILTGACILFFGMWFFKGSESKEIIKRLEKENLRIEKIKDSLKLANESLSVEFYNIQQKIDERDRKIKDIEKKLLKTKKDLEEANAKLNLHKKDLDDTKKKIENLKNNPIKKEDEDLLKSLKEKLK